MSAGSNAYTGNKHQLQILNLEISLFLLALLQDKDFAEVIYFSSPIQSYLLDNSITDQSESMETHSTEDIVMSADLPSDPSERKVSTLAEAAVQDGEKESKENYHLNKVLFKTV